MPHQSTALFRTEAMRHAGSHFAGDVRLLPAFSATLMTLILLALILVSALVVGNSGYARKILTEGVIDTHQAREIVAPARGELLEIKVREQQQVSKGALLAIIDQAEPDTDLELQYLDREALQVEQLLASGRQQNEHRQLQLKLEKRQIRRLLKLTLRDLHMQEQKLALKKEQEAGLIELRRRQRLSVLEWTTHQASLLSEQQRENSIREQIVELNHRLEVLDSEVSVLEVEHQQLIADSALRLAALEKRQAVLRRSAHREVTASISGVITRISADRNSHVEPGTTLMTISGGNLLLTGTLYLPPEAVSSLHPGQQLVLEMDPASSRQSATLNARVLDIPGHPVLSGPRQGWFASRIQIIDEPEAGQRYRPGMPFRTSVKTDRKRILEWITDPIRQRLAGI